MYRSLGKIYQVKPGKIIIQGYPVAVDPIDIDVPIEQAARDVVDQVKPHANELLGDANTLIQNEVQSLKTWGVAAAALFLAALWLIQRK